MTNRKFSRLPAFAKLAMLVFLAGCGPVAARTTPTPNGTVAIDDFEAAQTDWRAGTADFFSDSSATGIALSKSHCPQGNQCLRLDFNANDQPKAIFFVDRTMDFRQGNYLRFKLVNDGAAGGVGFAVTTGTDSTWFESDSELIETRGMTDVIFDLTAAVYKAASTNWEFRAAIADLGSVSRLAVIIYPAANGSVYLDDVRLTDSVPIP